MVELFKKLKIRWKVFFIVTLYAILYDIVFIMIPGNGPETVYFKITMFNASVQLSILIGNIILNSIESFNKFQKETNGG